MSTLVTSANIADPDRIYDLLIQLHDGLSDEESARANSRLILLLINHIGDGRVIGEAIRLARAAPGFAAEAG